MLRILMESSPQGVASLDAAWRILDCNPWLCRFTGVSREQLTGREFIDLLGPLSRQEIAAHRRRLVRNGSVELELEMVPPGGQPIPVWARIAAPRHPGAGALAFIVFLRDVSERKKLDELKDDFLRMVSHEFKTPLTVVIGVIETLLSNGGQLPPAEVTQLLEDAALDAQNLNHILDNLLEISRSQASRIALQPEPVDIAKVAARVVAGFQGKSPHRFVTDFAPGLPPLVVDPVRIERVFYNLVQNAVKYSPRGGEIAISGRLRDRRVLIEVRDQGIGIPVLAQSRLFGAFERVPNEANFSRGSGLGLLACRRLVEAHGGRIWVKSKAGQGSRFYFTLPARK